MLLPEEQGFPYNCTVAVLSALPCAPKQTRPRAQQAAVNRASPRASCTSPGDIFNQHPKSKLPVSSVHQPHPNIVFPGDVGHARNVSEPSLPARWVMLVRKHLELICLVAAQQGT